MAVLQYTIQHNTNVIRIMLRCQKIKSTVIRSHNKNVTHAKLICMSQ